MEIPKRNSDYTLVFCANPVRRIQEVLGLALNDRIQRSSCSYLLPRASLLECLHLDRQSLASDSSLQDFSRGWLLVQFSAFPHMTDILRVRQYQDILQRISSHRNDICIVTLLDLPALWRHVLT